MEVVTHHCLYRLSDQQKVTTREIIHLVGNFQVESLEKWTQFAVATGRDVRHSTYNEISLLKNDSPIIIMCTHGLNDLELS